MSEATRRQGCDRPPAARCAVPDVTPPSPPSPTPLLPAERDLDQAALITKGDPSLIFESSKKLGEGASGTVFLATDRRTRAKVAVKMAPAADLANLKTEIALQKLSAHPNVVSYLETFLHKDQLWVSAAGHTTNPQRAFWLKSMAALHVRRVDGCLAQ